MILRWIFRKFGCLLIWFFAYSPDIIPDAQCQTHLHQGPVKIIRDHWGIPHVYADDEWSLFYGAGYAAAQDRLLQLMIVRYSVQGRLAEFFGSSFLEWDKRMRMLGLYSHAQFSYAFLSEEIQQYLQAYAEGVNAYMHENPSHLSHLFSSFGMTPEPWAASDCIAAWLRLCERFDRGWMNEVAALRNFEALEDSLGREDAIAKKETERRCVDDESVIVSQTEYMRYQQEFEKLLTGVRRPSLQPRSQETASLKTRNPSDESPHLWKPPKMSHDWVISGTKSVTGLPILESDPQISVEAPSTWYEFHLCGGRFNVRGIGIPGSPVMLLGFNENCSWGLTALGSDNADLFQEKLRPGTRNVVAWQDTWERIEEREETIRVKHGQSVVYTIRTTRHGPIVNDFVHGLLGNELYALKYLITAEPATTVEGLFGMMAAVNWIGFSEAAALYRAPGVHLIYADRWNTIAYYTLAHLPIRAHNAGIPYRGWTGDEEWQGKIPFDAMPRMLNPLVGFITTANNAPIGSWYPYAVGGGIGDNARSWRLKELLAAKEKYSTADFLEIHRDATNPIIRDFVRFSLMAVNEEHPTDPNTLAAAQILMNWDFVLDTSSPAYRLASNIGPTIHRSLRNTPLKDRYLGGDAGLVMLLRDVDAYYEATGKLIPDPDIRNWLITNLGQAYINSGISDYSPGLVVKHTMHYQNNLEGLGSLSPGYDIVSPPLHCGVVSTIWSQKGNSYSQLVNHADIDASLSVLPPGNSEIPNSDHYDDQVALWVDGQMHAAPLTQNAVEAVKESETWLNLTHVNDHTQNDPAKPILFGSYPNPFNHQASISFMLPRRNFVRLHIFNIRGRCIKILDEGWLESGTHLVTWDGTDLFGTKVATGTYTVRLNTDDQILTSNMTVMK